MKVAVISDSHGLLRPRTVELVRGCDRILHAGDVGRASILDELRRLAPVSAVRGNVDGGDGLADLPETISGDLAGLPFRMVHRRQDVDPLWVREARLVIYGHSHRPELGWQSGCLLLNPGAVGGRRFKLPLTMARLTLVDGRILPEILSVE